MHCPDAWSSSGNVNSPDKQHPNTLVKAIVSGSPQLYCRAESHCVYLEDVLPQTPWVESRSIFSKQSAWPADLIQLEGLGFFQPNSALC